MMANDIKTTLTDRMAGFESFSIALDESTDLSDTVQLAIFIRGVDKELNELLALQPLKPTTTAAYGGRMHANACLFLNLHEVQRLPEYGVEFEFMCPGTLRSARSFCMALVIAV
ncbi:General transcription factor II-I repeat domain-containing protein 2B [Eumeta japonica]|uniref:General transcription factor II-I repeat domain-containing protein 2B n=1 Tax=Eumeta variegata TaxID=151549 RepID=A0A4C1SSP2_EUMVA|nr:General transcription factor II-I repeat domain-containing protein 2B [Eumeta japonica]